MRSLAMAGDDREPHETDQSGDLEHREQVLHGCALLRTSRIDERETEQQPDS